jgi:hypothetical protein
VAFDCNFDNAEAACQPAPFLVQVRVMMAYLVPPHSLHTVC